MVVIFTRCGFTFYHMIIEELSTLTVRQSMVGRAEDAGGWGIRGQWLRGGCTEGPGLGELEALVAVLKAKQVPITGL